MDITGKSQHGFKKNRSTASLSLTIQTIISQALEDDCHAIMASLDLSAAFDTVNIDLLLKRMRTIGLPDDLVGLVEVWLKDRCFYVSIDGNNSLLYDLHVVLNSMPIFDDDVKTNDHFLNVNCLILF